MHPPAFCNSYNTTERLWGEGYANRRGMGVTRQRRAWRCAWRLSRYHARIDEGGAFVFSAFVEKRRGDRCDCAWLAIVHGMAGAQGANRRSSRSDRRRKIRLAKVGSVGNGRAVRVLGLGMEVCAGRCGDIKAICKRCELELTNMDYLSKTGFLHLNLNR